MKSNPLIMLILALLTALGVTTFVVYSIALPSQIQAVDKDIAALQLKDDTRYESSTRWERMNDIVKSDFHQYHYDTERHFYASDEMLELHSHSHCLD